MALETEIAYFNEQAPELLANHRDEWVLIEGRRIVGLYRDFQLAITDAIRKFGDSPFLIRQIDAPPHHASTLNHRELMIWSFSKEGPDFPTRAAKLVREGPTLPIVIAGGREHLRTIGGSISGQ